MPPSAPTQELIACAATVTTPPPSGKRALTSAYLKASSTNTDMVSSTKKPARLPTRP